MVANYGQDPLDCIWVLEYLYPVKVVFVQQLLRFA
jgi:hypothetical protein